MLERRPSPLQKGARVEERACIPTALSRSAPRLLVLVFFPNSKRVLISYLSCRSPPGRRGSPGRCPHSTRNSGCRSRWPCGAPVVVPRVCRLFPRVRWPFVSTSSYRYVCVGRSVPFPRLPCSVRLPVVSLVVSPWSSGRPVGSGPVVLLVCCCC